MFGGKCALEKQSIITIVVVVVVVVVVIAVVVVVLRRVKLVRVKANKHHKTLLTP